MVSKHAREKALMRISMTDEATYSYTLQDV